MVSIISKGSCDSGEDWRRENSNGKTRELQRSLGSWRKAEKSLYKDEENMDNKVSWSLLNEPLDTLVITVRRHLLHQPRLHTLSTAGAAGRGAEQRAAVWPTPQMT